MITFAQYFSRLLSEGAPPEYWGSKEQPYWRPGANCTVDLVLAYKSKILLIKRSHTAKAEPGKWAIPGGFIDTNAKTGELFRFDKETPKQAATRELAEETGLEVNSIPDIEHRLKEVGVFEGSKRDPRDNEEAWSKSYAFTLSLTDEDGIDFSKIRGMDDAEDAKWFDIDSLPDLAFDHDNIIRKALTI